MTRGDRLRHFWDCCVSHALRDSIEQCIDSALTRDHLWLGRPPRAFARPVWDIVVLAFTTAADEGRRALYAARSPDAPTLSHTALQCIGSQTCAAFWGLLHNHAARDLPPKDWTSVPLQHPFLCRSVDGRVRFVPPPDLDFD